MLTHKFASALVKYIAIRSVRLASSGHPGAPLGCSDIMTVLWRHVLEVSPGNPSWVNRDRFVLSNGHASAMLYALLYLRGFDMSWDELSQFRSLHSATPGHPEKDLKRGIEMTTGPLGQGFGAAVGMALAEKIKSDRLSHHEGLVDHMTYVLVGDGCLMEGVSHEAANLASSWNLEKLVVMWDDNQITIDGAVSKVSKEDTLSRFKSYGWDVLGPVDGHDEKEIKKAFAWANNRNGKPKFIDFKTVIGHGVTDGEGTAGMHGAPLNDAQWDQIVHDLQVSDDIATDEGCLQQWRESAPHKYDAWMLKLNALSLSPSDKKLLWNDQHELLMPKMPLGVDAVATRKASHTWIKAVCEINENLVGGSADLDASVLTKPDDDSAAHYVHYGVREFGMCTVANGLALSGFRPYVGTFLVFSDYAKNAIRLAAMMNLPVIYVLTHDSIALGEDGPTHQPIEQLLALRSIPNVTLWRPADARETYASWSEAMKRTDGPSVLVLSRQSLPCLAPEKVDVSVGAYSLRPCDHPDLILLATGSEVSLAVEVRERLSHLKIEVVSCPNLNLFRHSDYHKHLQNKAPIFVIEAGSSWCWGDVQSDPAYRVTMDSFGVSAPGKVAQHVFGFSVDHVLKKLSDIGYD